MAGVEGVRLALLNLWLRFVVKRRLARAGDPVRQRALFERDVRFFRAPADARFEDAAIPRPDGEPMPATWAWRGEKPASRAILYLHGGAFFCGSPRTHRHLGAALAGQAGARALLPGYRLAPEDPFPAALDDAVAAYRHLLASFDASRIVLAGDSSGGGLAFALLLRLRELGLPAPAAVAAFSPWVDLTAEADSLRRNARREAMLPAKRFAEVVEFYLAGHDPADPLASPALGQFDRPPPALVMASRDELLVDDAVHIAEALRRGGGDVELELWPRMPHAWPIFTGRLAEADQALERAGRFLDRHLGAARA